MSALDALDAMIAVDVDVVSMVWRIHETLQMARRQHPEVEETLRPREKERYRELLDLGRRLKREGALPPNSNDLDPLIGIQRAHIELYIRHLGDGGLRVSSVKTMMHGVRGFFRFAHIDGLITADPAVYARLPKIHTDESRTQGLLRRVDRS